MICAATRGKADALLQALPPTRQESVASCEQWREVVAARTGIRPSRISDGATWFGRNPFMLHWGDD